MSVPPSQAKPPGDDFVLWPEALGLGAGRVNESAIRRSLEGLAPVDWVDEPESQAIARPDQQASAPAEDRFYPASRQWFRTTAAIPSSDSSDKWWLDPAPAPLAAPAPTPPPPAEPPTPDPSAPSLLSPEEIWKLAAEELAQASRLGAPATPATPAVAPPVIPQEVPLATLGAEPPFEVPLSPVVELPVSMPTAVGREEESDLDLSPGPDQTVPGEEEPDPWEPEPPLLEVPLPGPAVAPARGLSPGALEDAAVGIELNPYASGRSRPEATTEAVPPADGGAGVTASVAPATPIIAFPKDKAAPDLPSGPLEPVLPVPSRPPLALRAEVAASPLPTQRRTVLPEQKSGRVFVPLGELATGVGPVPGPPPSTEEEETVNGERRRRRQRTERRRVSDPGRSGVRWGRWCAGVLALVVVVAAVAAMVARDQVPSGWQAVASRWWHRAHQWVFPHQYGYPRRGVQPRAGQEAAGEGDPAVGAPASPGPARSNPDPSQAAAAAGPELARPVLESLPALEGKSPPPSTSPQAAAAAGIAPAPVVTAKPVPEEPPPSSTPSPQSQRCTSARTDRGRCHCDSARRVHRHRR